MPSGWANAQSAYSHRIQTGIGAWSGAAFTRAMRRGVARDGHLLYPAFPYSHYVRMTQADIDDLYAYFMTRPAVAAPARENRMTFPFGFRPLDRQRVRQA